MKCLELFSVICISKSFHIFKQSRLGLLPVPVLEFSFNSYLPLFFVMIG